MALQLLKKGEGSRLAGTIIWVEDLERLGLPYGALLGYLEDCGVQCVCSPVHDRDTYTPADVRGWLKRHEDLIDADTGEIAPEYIDLQPKVGDSKKSHIHIYVKSSGPKKAEQWTEIMKPFAELNYRWVKVQNWDYIVRYCAHMDAPSKAQYDPLSVKGFGNADISALMNVQNVNKYQVLAEVNEYIQRNKVKHFHRLNRWALQTGDVNIIACVTGRASYFSAIFQSQAAEKAERENAKKTQAQL